MMTVTQLCFTFITEPKCQQVWNLLNSWQTEAFDYKNASKAKKFNKYVKIKKQNYLLHKNCLIKLFKNNRMNLAIFSPSHCIHYMTPHSIYLRSNT